MSEPDVMVVFEILGDLYYRRYHRLRPGKSEAPETYRESNDDENRAQFAVWTVNHALMDAIARIVKLQEEVETLTEQRDVEVSP